MSAEIPVKQSSESRVPLRNEPVQARSTARLAALLDAAATIVDEIGYEHLTTAMVSERAGASIGTVYRYFPDRIALLQALGARNLERVLGAASAAVRDPQHENWVAALSAAFAVLVEAFRAEPGFRGLRVGDVIDLRPSPNLRPYNSVVADHLLDGLIGRFAVTDTPELRFAFEASIEITDALVARAFARHPQGHEPFLSTSNVVVYGLLAPHLGTV